MNLFLLCIDKNILINNLEGHEDAIWGISIHHDRPELLSCSADGSVKLWSPTNLKTPCLSSYVSDQGIIFNLKTLIKHILYSCNIVTYMFVFE